MSEKIANNELPDFPNKKDLAISEFVKETLDFIKEDFGLTLSTIEGVGLRRIAEDYYRNQRLEGNQDPLSKSLTRVPWAW